MKYTGIAKEFIEWAELYRKPFITDVTWIKYELAARRFQTMFLDMKAKDLTRALVQRAYNDLAGQ